MTTVDRLRPRTLVRRRDVARWICEETIRARRECKPPDYDLFRRLARPPFLDDESSTPAPTRIVDRPSAPDANSDIESEIDDLYAELLALARTPPSPEREAAHATKLRRLRELEHVSAERMRAFFLGRLEADRREVADAARDAERLLAKHENAPDGH